MGRWSDLVSNKFIAKADVQDAINTGVADPIGITPSIADEKFISKQQLQDWVNTSSVSGTSVQWVTKSDVTLIAPASLTSVSLRFSNSSAAAACAASPTTYWVSDNPLILGSYIRNSNSLYAYADLGWYSDGTTVWDYDGKTSSIGSVVGIASCSGSGTNSSSVLLGIVEDDICNYNYIEIVYYTGTYGSGTTLYIDSGLTVIVPSIYLFIQGPDSTNRNLSSGVVGSATGNTC